jgi:two-component system cell cycle response regulator DivK
MAKKILIVEDVEDSRAILVVMLQRYCGYETMEAATGLEAVEKAIADNPILSSWISGYPVCRGVDAAKILKENPSTAHIPIVAHTAWSAERWGDRVREAGMSDFLQKPVPIKVMKETIETLFIGLPHCYPYGGL